MWDWLMAPIDAERAHHVGWQLSYHARFMVLAWGVFIPSGILFARYFKVTPKQNWPEVLDNKFWWVNHLRAQYTALALMVFGLALILSNPDPAPSLTSNAWLHRALGWSCLMFASLQYLSGWLRGSKGGPTDENGLRGDHYDMTRRRLIFEYFHKTNGYLALGFAMAAIISGLWQANAPKWMWIIIVAWWVALLAFVLIYARKYRIQSTYEAIWGSSKDHPGNIG